MKTTQRVGSWLMHLSAVAGCAGQIPTTPATSPTLVTAAATQMPSVGLGASMHFNAPEGTDLLIPAGTYHVEEAGGTNLRLVTDTPQAMREVSATMFTHEESLTAPLSFIVREVEHEDTVHLLLMLPNGKGLDAAGRIGDVQTRGGDLRYRPRSQYSGMVMQQRLQQSAASTQKRSELQRLIEEKKKQLEQLQRELNEANDKSAGPLVGVIFGEDPGARTMHLQQCDVCKILQQRRQ